LTIPVQSTHVLELYIQVASGCPEWLGSSGLGFFCNDVSQSPLFYAPPTYSSNTTLVQRSVFHSDCSACPAGDPSMMCRFCAFPPNIYGNGYQPTIDLWSGGPASWFSVRSRLETFELDIVWGEVTWIKVNYSAKLTFNNELLLDIAAGLPAESYSVRIPTPLDSVLPSIDLAGGTLSGGIKCDVDLVGQFSADIRTLFGGRLYSEFDISIVYTSSDGVLTLSHTNPIPELLDINVALSGAVSASIGLQATPEIYFDFLGFTVLSAQVSAGVSVNPVLQFSVRHRGDE
jgi:hypothetical protein